MHLRNLRNLRATIALFGLKNAEAVCEISPLVRWLLGVASARTGLAANTLRWLRVDAE